MEIAVNEFSTLRWSFEQDVLKYASLGFNKIGVCRNKISDMGVTAAIDFLFEMKMEVSSVSWAGGFSGSNGLSYVEAIDDAKDAIELASRIGADCLLIHSGGRNGHTNRHVGRLFCTAIETLIPIAADYNVRLAIEPKTVDENPDWTSFQCFQSFFGLLDNYPTRHLGVAVDLYHCGLHESILESFKVYADRICLIQIADRSRDALSDRKLPGDGHVDIDRWLNGLHAAGANCAVEFEVYGYQNQSIPYGQRLERFAQYADQSNLANLAPLPKVYRNG